MNMLARAALWLSALCACAAPAVAQNAPIVTAPANNGSTVPSTAIGFGPLNGAYQTVDVLHGLPTALLCAVVTGDQAYTVGSAGGCTMTPTGRLKVGLSSSTNVDPAAQPATTLHSDLMGCKARIAALVWAEGTTGALSCDGAGNMRVADPSNASFTFAPQGGSSDSSTAASYTFTVASQAAARGWYANCPANTAVTVTLIGVNGGTRPRTLYDGPQGDKEKLAGFSGNAAGCTIGEEF